MTAPDPNSGPIPPPLPPAGPSYPPHPSTVPPVVYPPLSAPPDPLSVPPGSFSGPPAPYSVSPAAPTPARRSRGAVFAVVVAGLALLVAVVSLAVAWRAVDQAGDARQFALAGGDGPERPATQAPAPPPTTQAPPPTEAPATDPPVDDPAPSGTGAPALNEQTVYVPKYEDQSFTLRAEGCNATMYADLDEPRANVGAGGDIALVHPCADKPSYLNLSPGTAGSQAGSPGMSPHDCAERIRTAPLGDGVIPARKGVTVCMTTSFEAADERADNQRLILLEVTGVADDGAVTIKATAWNIPR